MGPILVFGHKNPDNDSICSAVAYAHLKNLTNEHDVFVPARLGPMPPETTWVFARFGVEPPELIDHVHTRVRDVMSPDPVTVESSENMLEAGRLMRERGVRALPVLENGKVRGLLDASSLAERYIAETSLEGFRREPVEVDQVVRALDGELLVGDPAKRLSGGLLIGAMEPETMRGYIEVGDTLIVGDRLRTQPLAIEAGVACLIVTGGARPVEDVLRLARERDCAVVSTTHDTYAAARLVSLCHRAGELMATNVLLVEPDMLLSEAAEDLLGSTHREAVAVDSQGDPVGMLTRTNLARGTRRRIVLVDHNEVSQSAAGVEQADVIEIVDHHRVGDIETASPVLFLNVPVGSTATIVATRYEDLSVTLPGSMAGLLLSAVLTDTVLLKSPTATDSDRDVAARLGAQLGIDPVEFGMEMFRARSAGHPFSAEQTVKGDLKEYRIGDHVVAIGQVETVELSEIMDHADEIGAVMDAMIASSGYDVVVLMVTDMVREGSELLSRGKTRLVERALDVELENGSVWLDGVLSRKRQIASRLIEAASR
jgi:manganese-dependent inorganic pyrophosphatase